MVSKNILRIFIFFVSILISISVNNKKIRYNNGLLNDEIKSVVYVESYQFDDLKMEKKKSTGTVISDDDLYCYILFNYHSIISLDSKLKVYDYLNISYDATLLDYNINNDLSIIRIKKSNNLIPIKRSTKDIDDGSTIIAVGYPYGNICISYGRVKGYKRENFGFDVIEHTAIINNGSSGGMLLNSDYKLIGINYAGKKGTIDNSIKSYSIPISIINDYLEFLNL